jgi:hypothetical protein
MYENMVLTDLIMRSKRVLRPATLSPFRFASFHSEMSIVVRKCFKHARVR